MVKIRDLSNKQLVQQIEKYQKIIDGLYKERQKRISNNQPPEELLTPKELAIAEEERKRSQENEQFQLKLDDEEIESIKKENEKVQESRSEDQEDLVRVTRLIQLSKSQLEELRKGKK